MDGLNRVKIKEQEPDKRVKNFKEVCLGYTEEEAIDEAKRCLNCKNPMCVKGCPVSIKIPDFIEQIKVGNFEEAYKIISEDSALPAVCGRVCPQEKQCEGKCIRGIKGEPIAIGKLERFVADWARANNIVIGAKSEKKEKKVAVVGAGPAGLTCAGELAKIGYEVVVFEALHKAGGVLSYGIPEFRLPKDEIVENEIKKIKALGVKIECNVVVGKTVTVDQLMNDEKFDAVFIASGAGLPKFMGIPGENLNNVFSANEFLTRANLMKSYKSNYDTPIHIGKKVAVIGGGNVAMDAARTAIRLGAETYVVYRRGMDEIPARKEEVHHAKEEGVLFQLLTNPKEIVGNENGDIVSMKCVKMELGEADSTGRRSVKEVPNSVFDLEVDTVIMALGTTQSPIISETTPEIQLNERKCIVINEKFETTKKGVFAGGDVTSGAATVILAMQAGKSAAKSIDEYLHEKS